MKHIPGIVLLVLAVAACNLSDKFKRTGSSNSSSSGEPSTTGGETVEKASPTAAQMAALANGQTVKWDQQGISWTMPANWTKEDVRAAFNFANRNQRWLTTFAAWSGRLTANTPGRRSW